ncbi:hypothetical protein DFJ74DRAFT_713179 [Hyaloraphidium curvatum]|nr:hypothetical protein DFJ74DRAFT_713179 [Hyaloraphidium curvatum]
MPDLDRSRGDKFSGQLAFTIARPLGPAVIYWLLNGGGQSLLSRFNFPAVAVDATRKDAVLAGVAVSAARQVFWVWYLLVTKFTVGDAIGVSVFNTVVDSTNALLALRTPAPWGPLDNLAVGLFVAGSVGETMSEVLRHWWKQDKANAGKPYTGGLFAYSTNFNYFSYAIWRSGMALLTRSWLAFGWIAFISYDFLTAAIPGKEKHNEAKYGEAYKAYAAKTAKFFPFIL